MCGLISEILLFICCLISTLHYGNCNGASCCHSIPDTASSCKTACIQLASSSSQLEQISLLASGPSQCPEHLSAFWVCAAKSVPALLESGTFSGRPCCNLTKTKVCREACLKARSESDLDQKCSRSTEDDKLYNCIARHKDGEKCCGKAISIGNTSDSQMCKAMCWNMYLTNSMSESSSKRQLRHHCTGQNKEVFQCLHKQTRPTRQSTNIDSEHCCAHTENQNCKDVCLASLRGDHKQEEKMEEIERACGATDIMDPLWQCFLRHKDKNSSSQDITRIVDATKLHCCDKARSEMCGSLCIKTHSWKWSTLIQKFEKKCNNLASPVSTMETEMLGCLKEVEEPCQLGCDGLQFCTTMNHRPTEHFRSCSMDADILARNDIRTWQKGIISLPNFQIPVKDIRSCEPDMWKAIACAYQIKPCYKKHTPPQICQEDCIYIMNKCVDDTRLEGQMVTDLCKRLPLTSTGECISVKQYTADSPYKNSAEEITTPCKPHPCRKDEVCLLHRRKCRHSAACPHYVCRKACKMGQVSEVRVPQNTMFLIPFYKNTKTVTSCQSYKVCHCTHKGELGECQDMQCLPKSHCIISAAVVKSHGEHYTTECNDCVCHAGETICTQRQCNQPYSVNDQQLTGIKDCACGREYKPVCGNNGKTYPSGCVARCAGQTIIQSGSCSTHDPCGNNPCEDGYICVAHRQVCLGNTNTPCIQYQCVEVNYCNDHHHEPVCATNGQEYTNHCLLLSKGKTLAYTGHCQTTSCSMIGSVCGHDGETYDNQCTALAARTTVDYMGLCKTLGYSTAEDSTTSLKCENVECIPVSPSSCTGIIPPWSCCPVCAAQLQILVSERLVSAVSSAVKQGPITLQNIVATLSSLMTVSECDVFGYLSLDGDVMILVAPVANKPTSLQVKACIKEAERFEYLILSRSPTFTSNMLLTPLLYTSLRAPVIMITSGAVIYTQPLLMTLTLIIVSHFTHRILGLEIV